MESVSILTAQVLIHWDVSMFERQVTSFERDLKMWVWLVFLTHDKILAVFHHLSLGHGLTCEYVVPFERHILLFERGKLIFDLSHAVNSYLIWAICLLPLATIWHVTLCFVRMGLPSVWTRSCVLKNFQVLSLS